MDSETILGYLLLSFWGVLFVVQVVGWTRCHACGQCRALRNTSRRQGPFEEWKCRYCGDLTLRDLYEG